MVNFVVSRAWLWSKHTRVDNNNKADNISYQLVKTEIKNIASLIFRNFLKFVYVKSEINPSQKYLKLAQNLSKILFIDL